MTKSEIEKIVNDCFDVELERIAGAMSMELYPAAFANEHSYLRVKAALELNNRAIRNAVKASIAEILSPQE